MNMNDDLKNLKKEKLAKREAQEKENAKKLVNTPRSKRKERAQEYAKTKAHLSQKDPNKKGFKLSEKTKDMMNPNSEFRGGGRLLQLTGTHKLAKKFINSVNGGGSDYSDNYSCMSTLNDLEKDNLKINGFYEEIKLIEQCEKGNCEKNKAYYDALDSIVAFKQRGKTENLNKKAEEESSEEKIYSAWDLLCKFCDN